MSPPPLSTASSYFCPKTCRHLRYAQTVVWANDQVEWIRLASIIVANGDLNASSVFGNCPSHFPFLRLAFEVRLKRLKSRISLIYVPFSRTSRRSKTHCVVVNLLFAHSLVIFVVTLHHMMVMFLLLLLLLIVVDESSSKKKCFLLLAMRRQSLLQHEWGAANSSYSILTLMRREKKEEWGVIRCYY